MDKKQIGVIFGGCSPEYNVSLESAYSVITNINKEKYDVILIGITKFGDWFKYNGNVENIKNDSWYNEKDCTKVILSSSMSDKGLIEIVDNKPKIIKLDAIFPVLHGKNGEDGTVQGLIELAGIKLIGCNLVSSALCMDKYLSHKLVESYGIKVAKNIVIDSKTSKEELIEKLKELTFPLFIKPMRAGSSFGITKVYKLEEVDKAVKEALKYDVEVIIEENIDGIELGCAILGNEELLTGQIDEISLADGFFNYTEKYTLKTSKIYCPARIEEKTSQKAKEIAKRIYRILKCKDFARVDMFLSKDGEIYFNEINTIPGFTSHSRYPNMMKEIGINFDKLVDKLISLEI